MPLSITSFSLVYRMTPGAVVTNEWWYAEDGGLTQVDGQWLHLPADEAGELLLWIEWVEDNQ